jgi:hypothetical protein
MTNKTEHPQAYLLRWIADGEEIECKGSGDTWHACGPNRLLTAIYQGSTYVDSCYRIKPKTIRIGRYDVAEPMKEAPKEGTPYYFIDPSEEDGVYEDEWDNYSVDSIRLTNGAIFLSKEDALLAAKVIKELLTGTGC